MSESYFLSEMAKHQSYLYMLSSGYVDELVASLRKSLNPLLTELAEALSELTEAEMSALAANRYTTRNLKDVQSIYAELSSAISENTAAITGTALVGLAAYESNYITSFFDDKTKLSPSKIVSVAKSRPIDGNMVSEMVRTLSASIYNKFVRAVRKGVDEGKTSAQISKELKGTKRLDHTDGLVEMSRKSIATTVRTIRNHVSNEAYAAAWQEMGFTHEKFIATLDGRTTVLCASKDGTIYKADSGHPRPPLHYNCRSYLVGCDKDGDIDGERPFVMSDKAVKNIPKDARDGIIGQVDANTTFEEWFKTTDAAFQRKYLGKTRYDLYRKNQYTITEFVAPSGKLYTIDQLRKMDKEQ